MLVGVSEQDGDDADDSLSELAAVSYTHLWHDNNVILKSWDVDKVSNVFGNGRNISENKTMPNMHLSLIHI